MMKYFSDPMQKYKYLYKYHHVLVQLIQYSRCKSIAEYVIYASVSYENI